MQRIVVLGAGMVGSAIAVDLQKQYAVTSVDIDEIRLGHLKENYGINVISEDLSKPELLKKVIKNYDLVISAVPGSMGYQTLKTIIQNGKNVIDIAFFPEDVLDLDDLARKAGVTAVVDCGVAPGMSNLLLGYHYKRMKVESFECLVGGLPMKRTWPYQYKAPFSPSDVIEEYIRPARLVENGKVVIREALSEPEMVNIDPVGTLEAFNTDGLRSLIKTVNVPNMKEKTVRYPGHIDYIRVLRETGFFSDQPITVKGQTVVPLDVSSNLLFKQWELMPEEPEFTVMQITISGTEHDQPQTYIYDMYDQYDKITQTSSMARTTGYACTAVANLVLMGQFSRKGISPPEYLGEDSENVDFVLQYLKERNIIYHVRKQQ
ncbi:MAG: saccharopine dehydrogenase NADP-binding domain-containing protein [Candidatus Marinimicrobia bacterium]|nr:saccharopine dehydrogenase NADP-binding domain-containing protein [Candidatus Neomarinimicrobiota bacterium]